MLSSNRSTSSGRVGVRRRLLFTSLMYAPPLRTTSAHGCAVPQPAPTHRGCSRRQTPRRPSPSHRRGRNRPRARGFCDDHTHSRCAGPSEGRTGTPFAQIAGCLHTAQAADLNGPVVRLRFPGAGHREPDRYPAGPHPGQLNSWAGAAGVERPPLGAAPCEQSHRGAGRGGLSRRRKISVRTLAGPRIAVRPGRHWSAWSRWQRSGTPDTAAVGDQPMTPGSGCDRSCRYRRAANQPGVR
jgi:hypothetical protein